MRCAPRTAQSWSPTSAAAASCSSATGPSSHRCPRAHRNQAAPGKPYGLAYDAERRRLYVTLTATNQLQVFDVVNPDAPRIIGVVPTARQPNSVAVDPCSGAVLITGSSPEGTLQIVTPDLLPRA
jgi:DNA-binding beta-propeller fold protein YncE